MVDPSVLYLGLISRPGAYSKTRPTDYEEEPKSKWPKFNCSVSAVQCRKKRKSNRKITPHFTLSRIRVFPNGGNQNTVHGTRYGK